MLKAQKMPGTLLQNLPANKIWWAKFDGITGNHLDVAKFRLNNGIKILSPIKSDDRGKYALCVTDIKIRL